MHAEAAISHRSSKAHCRLLPGPDSFEPGHMHHVAQFSASLGCLGRDSFLGFWGIQLGKCRGGIHCRPENRTDLVCHRERSILPGQMVA